MPKEGISLYFTVKDGASPALTTLGDKTRALDKDTEELARAYSTLQKANEPLIRRQAELQKSISDVKTQTKDAKKAWEEYSDEVTEGIYSGLLQEQAELQAQLKDVNDQIRANQKTFNEYREDLRKGGLDGESALGGASADTGLASFGKKLLTGQLGQMASQAISGYLSSQLTSAIGTPDSELLSGLAGGLISGATAGAIAGPLGAAIGAVVGAGSGVLSGYTAKQQQKDEVFKDYYNGLYENALASRESAVESGSTLAAQREKDRISFSTLFGDDATAKQYLSDLVTMSNTTPFLYDDLTAMSKTLATYGFGADSILPVLQTVGDAGAALGMGVSDMNTVATAIGRMQSSDKASLEYLNMLNERGIGAVGMLADAKGVSQKDMYSMISKGEISGRDAVGIIMAALQEQFSGSMLTQSQTFSGLTSTLEGLKQELDNASGESYNTLRNEGLREEIDAYGGALGDALKEVNSLSGQNQAYLENLQDQFKREALEAVLLGEQTTLYDDETNASLAEMRDEYAEAKAIYEAGGEESQKAALTMENLKNEAEIVAQNAYDSSEAVKTLHDTQKELLDATRELTAAFDGWSLEYEFGVEQTKGRAAALGAPDALSTSYNDTLTANSGINRERGKGREGTGGRRNAFGLERVPYDGYAAILHQDERVLTAREARAQDESKGGIGNVSISFAGASFSGTTQEMAADLAEEIVSRLEQAAVAYGR